MRIPYLREAGAVLFIAGFLAYTGWIYHLGGQPVQRKFDAHLLVDAQAAQKASEAARKYEQAEATKSAQIAQAYEQGKQDAEAAGKRVADDLRSGAVRLRRMWAGCEANRVSDAATSPGEPDATGADRAESAGRIVRAAREADEQIKGLQDILRAERGR